VHTPLIPAMLFGGFGLVAVLHLLAAWREQDRASPVAADGWIAVGAPASIPDKSARTVSAPGGERIAVFRDGSEIGALTNLCAHQNGPIGEGRIIDGCVTCPWHGYQYQPDSGAAPAPFKERVPTFRVKVVEGSVFVHPRPNPAGTRVEPARIESGQVKAGEARP
jgi:nitrite reductase/ring-hydroxylating ferredoxin subunit